MIFNTVDDLFSHRKGVLEIQSTLRFANEFETTNTVGAKVRISIQGDDLFVNGVPVSAPTAAEFKEALAAVKYEIDKSLEDAEKKVARIKEVLRE